MKFQFNADAVKKSERDYSKIEVTKEQRKLAELIAKIMTPKIQMGELAFKGFIWKALKEVQMKHHTTGKAIAKMPVQQRKEFMEEGMEILGNYLKKLLKDEEQKQKIDDAIAEGLDFYLTNFEQTN